MAKALTENQCNWLHQLWPPPQCCICNHKGTIVVLEAEKERMMTRHDQEIEIVEGYVRGYQVQVQQLKAALDGLMEIAEDEMPDSYFITDSRVNVARTMLNQEDTDV